LPPGWNTTSPRSTPARWRCSSLCGLLGVGVSYGPSLIGAPQEAGVFLACMVGLFGVEVSREAARRVLKKKVDEL